MPVKVRPTIPDDAPQLAKIWLESLEANTMVQLASPDGITPRRLEGATNKTLQDLDDPTASCLTAYDDLTDDIMGCAVWRYYPKGNEKHVLPPAQPEVQANSTSAISTSVVADTSAEVDSSESVSTDKRTRTQEASGSDEENALGNGGVKPNIGDDLDQKSQDIYRRRVGRQPYATLSKVQTDPKHERKGVASALLQYGLERLEQTDLPAYQFSTPQAAKLYQKFGFKEIDRVVLELKHYGGRENDVYISPFYYRAPR